MTHMQEGSSNYGNSSTSKPAVYIDAMSNQTIDTEHYNVAPVSPRESILQDVHEGVMGGHALG